jgi:hypothetical protein
MRRMHDLIEGQPTPRGLRIMRFCSIATVVTSFGFAVAYASKPVSLQHSLFNALAVHWAWAAIQVCLGLGITFAHIRGGYHVQLAHGLGFIVQSLYGVLWLMSAIVTGNGWFVWPGIFFLCMGHLILSRLRWPKRGREFV